jgi:hypothetical protein
MDRPVRALALLSCVTALGCHTNVAYQPKDCSAFMERQCLTPFPSSWFEQADPHTPTGVRVVFPDGVLPVNAMRVRVKPSALGSFDGYSPATPIIVYFEQGVTASQLPGPDAGDASTASDSPIAIIDEATGERAPFFAELDANAAAGDRQGLIIRPLVRLHPSAHYAVAITTALKDSTGHALAPQGQFAKWASGSLSGSDKLSAISDRLDETARALKKAGIDRSQLALAFDFHTASEDFLTGRLVSMRDRALAQAPKGLGYQLTDVQNPAQADDPNALRTIEGTFDAPSFEAGTDPSLLNLDADQKPIMGAPAPWPLFAVIPRCALTAPGPVPLLILGHGLFDTAKSELLDDRSMLQNLCMVAVGTDWLGVTMNDYLNIASTVLPDANQFGLITDRLQQAHVNFQVLTRLALNALASDPAFMVNGHPAYDTSRVYYWGASNGGIQGATYLALSPDIDRGVLNVPGAVWSAMIWRSSHFATAITLLTEAYPDRLDQQVLIGLSQILWDHTDPINFAPHLASPLPGVANTKQVIYQEAIGDAQVPNICTRIAMRTIGARGLAPLVQHLYGIEEVSGPTSGVIYTQWDVMATPLPPSTNTPATDNPAHEAVRGLPAVVDQTRMFFQPNGTIVNTCSGKPCVFPPSS